MLIIYQNDRIEKCSPTGLIADLEGAGRAATAAVHVAAMRPHAAVAGPPYFCYDYPISMVNDLLDTFLNWS